MADAVVHVHVHSPCHQVVAVVQHAERAVIVLHPAPRTFAFSRMVFDDPLSNPFGGELQIGLFECPFFLGAVKFMATAMRARYQWRDQDYLVHFFWLPCGLPTAVML